MFFTILFLRITVFTRKPCPNLIIITQQISPFHLNLQQLNVVDPKTIFTPSNYITASPRPSIKRKWLIQQSPNSSGRNNFSLLNSTSPQLIFIIFFCANIIKLKTAPQTFIENVYSLLHYSPVLSLLLSIKSRLLLHSEKKNHQETLIKSEIWL